MSEASEVRGLTGRGYKRADARVWREVDPFPEDSAPAESVRATVPRLEDWGVTLEEARAMLLRQVCPACGNGPFKSPLNHVAKAHGIDRFAMRDLCGLTTNESVADPELSEHFAELGRQNDMNAVTAASLSRKEQRWTSAGAKAVAENLAGVTADQSRAALRYAHTPEARAKQGAALRARWGSMTDEERREASAHLRRSPEELSKQAREAWARRGLQPCGTVASYKRGCRCAECKAAKASSRA